MPLARLLTGHGDEVTAHADLVRQRLGDHERRCDRIVEALRGGQRERLRDRHPPVVAARPSPSSRCSSSGRCSGTSTFCSTPAGSRSDVTDDGSTYGAASFALAATTTTTTR